MFCRIFLQVVVFAVARTFATIMCMFLPLLFLNTFYIVIVRQFIFFLTELRTMSFLTASLMPSFALRV
jgi:hypothetical protein